MGESLRLLLGEVLKKKFYVPYKNTPNAGLSHDTLLEICLKESEKLRKFKEGQIANCLKETLYNTFRVRKKQKLYPLAVVSGQKPSFDLLHLIQNFVEQHLESSDTTTLSPKDIVQRIKSDVVELKTIEADSVANKLAVVLTTKGYNKKQQRPALWFAKFQIRELPVLPQKRYDSRSASKENVAQVSNKEVCTTSPAFVNSNAKKHGSPKKRKQRSHNVCSVQFFGERMKYWEVKTNFSADSSSIRRDPFQPFFGSLPSFRTISLASEDLCPIFQQLCPYFGGRLSPEKDVAHRIPLLHYHPTSQSPEIGGFISLTGEPRLLVRGGGLGVSDVLVVSDSLRGCLQSQLRKLTRQACWEWERILVEFYSHIQHRDEVQLPADVQTIAVIDFGEMGAMKYLFGGDRCVEVRGSHVVENNSTGGGSLCYSEDVIEKEGVERGRCVLIFRSYPQKSLLRPTEKVDSSDASLLFATSALSMAIQNDMKNRFSVLDSSSSLTKLLGELFSFVRETPVLQAGGYNHRPLHNNFGYAPSEVSIFSSLSRLHLAHLFPELCLGKPLPATFTIPFASRSLLWSSGLHANLDSSIHSDPSGYLISLRIFDYEVLNRRCPTNDSVVVDSLPDRTRAFCCAKGCCFWVPLNKMKLRSPQNRGTHRVFLYHPKDPAPSSSLLASPGVEMSGEEVSAYWVDKQNDCVVVRTVSHSPLTAVDYCSGVYKDPDFIQHACSLDVVNGVFIRKYRKNSEFIIGNLNLEKTAFRFIHYDPAKALKEPGSNLCNSCSANRQYVLSLTKDDRITTNKSINQKSKQISRLNHTLKERTLKKEQQLPALKLRPPLSPSMNQQPQDYLCYLIQEVLEKYPNWPNSFNYTFICDQLRALAVENGRQFRWSPDVVEFFGSILFIGGKKTIKTLRGKAFGGQGSRAEKLVVESSNFNIITPSLSTLRGDLPYVNPYSPPLDSRAAAIAKMFKKKECQRVCVDGEEEFPPSPSPVASAPTVASGPASIALSPSLSPVASDPAPEVLSPSPVTSSSSLSPPHPFFCSPPSLQLSSPFLDGTASFEGGLVSDEIEIRHGMVFNHSTGQIVGLDRPLLPSQIDPHYVYDHDLAQKILQFFFVSNCGTICLPIAYYPTISLTGNSLYSHTKSIVDALEKENISVTWSSSDGFKGSKEYVSRWQNGDQKRIHFFDYVHMVKLGRNAILNKELKKDGVTFSMQDLYQWRQSSPKLQFLLSLDDVAPSDKQDLGPVKKLLKSIPVLKEFGMELDEEGKAKVKAFCGYLEIWETVYDIFNNNDTNHTTKNQQITKVLNYFEDWEKQKVLQQQRPSKDLRFQVRTTLSNLTSFLAMNPSFCRFSILGTNIVENFFSLIRWKIRFPNLFEYAGLYSRVWRELVKRFMKNRSWSLPYRQSLSRSQTKKYNDQSGIIFDEEDLELPADPKLNKEGEKLTETQRQRCLLLVSLYPTTRKKLTTRQTTCLSRLDTEVWETYGGEEAGVLVCCPAPGCARMFKNKGCLESHLSKKHKKWIPSSSSSSSSVPAAAAVSSPPPTTFPVPSLIPSAPPVSSLSPSCFTSASTSTSTSLGQKSQNYIYI